MLIAGEASGDLLAAELVVALRKRFSQRLPVATSENQPLHATLAPRFFGAGGAQMAAAGVDLAFDLTRHSVVGFTAVAWQYFKFRRLLNSLVQLAASREPDVIICIDFSGFNRRLAQAIRRHTRKRTGWFHDWQPKIVQYVSPQVWAWRESRVYQIARDYDLVLSIFPFEKEWYGRRVPQLRVEFVGHPILDRYGPSLQPAGPPSGDRPPLVEARLSVLLLPGSRRSELARHLPVLKAALTMIRTVLPDLRARMVLPNDALLAQAKSYSLPAEIEVQVGGLAEALRESTIAIASTGTVTVECAYFGVPTIAMYKRSWLEFQIGRHLSSTRFMAMPNILAKDEIFPEFIAHIATPGNIARAALDLLRSEERRKEIRQRLASVIAALGQPGASRRAAIAILSLDPRLLY